MTTNLYQALNTNTEKKKSSIGYTLTSYKDVLKDLQQDKVKVIEREVVTDSGGNVQYADRYYTLLKSSSFVGDVNNNGGFFFKKDTDEPLYQGLVSIKDYMSFIVDVNDKMSYVPVSKKKKGLDDGRGLKSGITFPQSTGSGIKQMKQDSGGKCYVGVGISLEDFGLKFFNTYYKDLNITEAKLSSIASKGLLYIQIAIPITAASALYFHAKVTTNTATVSTGPFQAWIPIPILLLNDFSKIGSVIVDGIGKEVKVGQGEVTFPLAGNRYYHKDASIDGFTPSLLEQYMNAGTNATTINYKRTTLATTGKETQGRARLYFDKEAESILGAITDEYKQNLFRGYLSEDDVTAYESYIVGGNDYVFNSKGGIFLDVGHIKSGSDIGGTGAESIIKDKGGKNINEYWFNQRIAKKFAEKLVALGINVNLVDYPTSDNDAERRKVKEEFLKQQNSYAAFISIHCNSYGDLKGNVIWVTDDTQGGSNAYVWGGKTHPRNSQSDVLGNLLAAAMRTIMTGRKGSSTVKPETDRVGILEEMKAPAVLLELGFMNHKADCQKLADDSVVERLTTAMAQAVDTWIKSVKQN